LSRDIGVVSHLSVVRTNTSIARARIVTDDGLAYILYRVDTNSRPTHIATQQLAICCIFRLELEPNFPNLYDETPRPTLHARVHIYQLHISIECTLAKTNDNVVGMALLLKEGEEVRSLPLDRRNESPLRAAKPFTGRLLTYILLRLRRKSSIIRSLHKVTQFGTCMRAAVVHQICRLWTIPT
jgi:hypothetical protein